MLKTFRELVPGDTIFRVNLHQFPKVVENSCSSYPAYLEGALRYHIEAILKDDNVIRFSDGSLEYNSRRLSSFLNLPNHALDEAEFNYFNHKGDWFKFYSNFETFHTDLDQIALNLLEIEEEILRSTQRLKERNQSTIRQVFWDFLNPKT